MARRVTGADALREAFMTPQEKDLITTLLTRLKSAGGQPKDPEAEAPIR